MAHRLGAAGTTVVPLAEGAPVRIDVREALHLLGQGQRVSFVDARCSDDWKVASHKLPGAVRLAPDRADETLPIIRPGRVAVVYCTSPAQTSSAAAARLLRASGYERVRVLDGGLEAWRRAGGPLEAT